MYPAGPYGLNALQIINDITFMGFRDGGDPFTQLSLSDYYDPDGAKGIKALYITFGWNGCGACIEEAGNMNKWETQYRSQGLRQLSALHSDIQTPNFGPATTSRRMATPSSNSNRPGRRCAASRSGCATRARPAPSGRPRRARHRTGSRRTA